MNAVQTQADVYQRKAAITRKRRAAGNKASREIMAALNAYAQAVAEARRNGKPAPFFVDFLGAK